MGIVYRAKVKMRLKYRRHRPNLQIVHSRFKLRFRKDPYDVGKLRKEAVALARTIQYSFQRYEKKYLLTPAQYEWLKVQLSPYMKADEFGRYTICNIYYDTPDFQLIRKSLEKPVYKEKLRMRSYGVASDTSQVFVELKKKFDGVVYKRRAVMDVPTAVEYLAGAHNLSEEGQICHEIDWFRDRWLPEPQVFIGYDREALADRGGGELRVTFDTNLRWRDTDLDLRRGDYGAPILPPEKILMEVKIPGVAPMWMARLFSHARIFPTSFSKYGACYQQNLLHRAENPAERTVRPCA